MHSESIRITTMEGFELNGLLQVPQNPRAMMLMLHGLTGSIDNPMGLAAYLATRLHQIRIGTLRFDFRGHGKSSGKMHDVSYLRCVQDVKAAIHHLEPWKTLDWHLMGNSFGGGVAILVAWQYSTRFRSLTVTAPVIDPRRTFLHLVEQPLPEFKVWLRHHEHFQEAHPDGLLPVFEEGEDPCNDHFLDEIRFLRPYQFMEELTMPFFYFHGEQDVVVPWAINQLHISKLSQVHTKILANADHSFRAPGDDEGSAPETQKMREALADWWLEQQVKFLQ